MKKLPPFVDHHVHLFIDGRECLSEESAETIINPLSSKGILGFYDMGSKSALGLNLKRSGVSIFSAGKALCKKGGYGGFLGFEVSDIEDIKMAIRWNVSRGADFIKVINSGIVTGNPDKPVSEGGFSREELKVIVQEAAASGKVVRCHANSEGAIKDAILSGVSTIEHGFFIDEDCLYLMAESGVIWIPTIYALKAYSLGIIDSDKRRYLDSIVDDHMQSVYKGYGLGVVIKAGSDSGAKGVPHGEAFIEELRLLRSAGLTIRDVLRAATIGQTTF